jgi:hypothetical protein
MSVANVSVIAASTRLTAMRGAIRLYERKPGGKSANRSNMETTAPSLQRQRRLPSADTRRDPMY